MLLRSLGVPARVATGYVPSDRDPVAGVWISRASDAHAWVEVRFPNFGWVAFDPTASVPLAGESTGDTIGAAIARALASAIGDHLPLVLGTALALAALVLATRMALGWWRRRQRGRWGVLQDRFVDAALRRGGSPTAPNAELAAVFDQPEAEELAAALDASAFSANWVDDDTEYDRALADLAALAALR
jgi:transglutaminase-like putative cysteine protease